MSLIDRVAELEARNDVPPHVAILVTHQDMKDMLSILSEIRPGDTTTISEIIDNFTFMGDPISGVYADCLRRYQAMAARMGAEE
jgi:hypothetical protein